MGLTFKKETKNILTNIITYILIAIILIIYTIMIMQNIFTQKRIEFRSPIYYLKYSFIILIPILAYFNYSNKDFKLKEDRNILISQESTFGIVMGKIFSTFIVAMIPIAIMFLSELILSMTIYKSGLMMYTIYIFYTIFILMSSAITHLIYTIFKDENVAAVISIIFQALILAILLKTNIEVAILLPFLQGILPINIIITMFLIIFVLIIAMQILLNKKRGTNIFNRKSNNKKVKSKVVKSENANSKSSKIKKEDKKKDI